MQGIHVVGSFRQGLFLVLALMVGAWMPGAGCGRAPSEAEQSPDDRGVRSTARPADVVLEIGEPSADRFPTIRFGGQWEAQSASSGARSSSGRRVEGEQEYLYVREERPAPDGGVQTVLALEISLPRMVEDGFEYQIHVAGEHDLAVGALLDEGWDALLVSEEDVAPWDGSFLLQSNTRTIMRVVDHRVD